MMWGLIVILGFCCGLWGFGIAFSGGVRRFN